MIKKIKDNIDDEKIKNIKQQLDNKIFMNNWLTRNYEDKSKECILLIDYLKKSKIRE